MKKLLIGLAIMLTSFQAHTSLHLKPQQHIEPYLYATVEVEDIMPFLCNELILTINPKACVYEWRECMIVEMKGEDLDHKQIFNVMSNCMPVSINK